MLCVCRFRDPLPALRNVADVQVSHDGWGPNIGMMYLRPTNSTLGFMRAWLGRRTAPDSRDQYEFHPAVEAALEGGTAPTIHYLDKGVFPERLLLWEDAACEAGSGRGLAVLACSLCGRPRAEAGHSGTDGPVGWQALEPAAPPCNG